MDNEKPEVTGVNILHVPINLSTAQIKEYMDNWIDEHPEVTTDPGQVVIFSPYDMHYTLKKVDGVDHLQLMGYMDRTKWATLSDANELREFAFKLEKEHANLKVEVILALSVKEYEETDEDYDFVHAYMSVNEEVREMIIKMNMEENENNEESSEQNIITDELNEDLDSAIFGNK